MTNRDQQEEIAHLNVQLDQLTNIVKVSLGGQRDSCVRTSAEKLMLTHKSFTQDGNRRVATALRSIACALNTHKEENRRLKERLDEMILIIGRNTQQLHQQSTRRVGQRPPTFRRERICRPERVSDVGFLLHVVGRSHGMRMHARFGEEDLIRLAMTELYLVSQDGRHPCYVEVTTSRPSSGADRGDRYHKN